MKRILFFFLFLMLFSTAYAEKARFADRADYSSHLSLHIGETTLTCTGNYVKVKEKGDVVGHLEQADIFKLEDVSGSTALVKIINSPSTSPDSYNGLEGWVDIRFIDCGCSEAEYYIYEPFDASSIVLKEGIYGDIYSQRASAIVTMISEGTYAIEVEWGDSAFEEYTWTMTAVMTDNGILEYHDCIEKDIITGDDDSTTERNVNIIPDGYFVPINERMFDWSGAAEENCHNCIFEID